MGRIFVKQVVHCGLVALAALAITIQPVGVTSARAQATGMAGVGQSQTITVRATVEAVDLPSRTVTLVGPQGNSLTVQVSDAVRNLPQVKPGDKVNVTYVASAAYVLAPKGSKLPDDSLTAGAVRAPQGQMPAGAVGAKLVVTGTVVGIDSGAHTLQLVNPSGGPVRTIAVVTPQGQKAMQLIKVGDTITAIISQAVAVSVEPAA